MPVLVLAVHSFHKPYLMKYRSHCAMFPDAVQLTPRHIRELKDWLVYSIGGMQRDFTSHLYSSLFVLDVSTSLTSTVSSSIEELRNLLALVEHFQVDGLGSVATYGKTICLYLISKIE
jgi:hypothetical protein